MMPVLEANVRVLVADDDQEALELLTLGLAREGADVTAVPDGREALDLAIGGSFDVLVLDVEMPGLSGFDVLQALRDVSRSMPVIFVTGRSSEGDRILGLDLGADDYAVKPVSTRELGARIRAVMRRRTANAHPGSVVMPLVVDRKARRVAVGDADVSLSPKEFELLAVLVERPGEVRSREELLELIWGSAEPWQSRTTLIEHVRRVRAKLDAAGGGWGAIENVRAFGYRYEMTTES